MLLENKLTSPAFDEMLAQIRLGNHYIEYSPEDNLHGYLTLLRIKWTNTQGGAQYGVHGVTRNMETSGAYFAYGDEMQLKLYLAKRIHVLETPSPSMQRLRERLGRVMPNHKIPGPLTNHFRLIPIKEMQHAQTEPTNSN